MIAMPAMSFNDVVFKFISHMQTILECCWLKKFSDDSLKNEAMSVFDKGGT